MLTGCNLCLVLAMGVHARVQVPHLLPPVLAALADSKPNVRQAALAVMNTFLKVTGSFITHRFFYGFSLHFTYKKIVLHCYF